MNSSCCTCIFLSGSPFHCIALAASSTFHIYNALWMTHKNTFTLDLQVHHAALWVMARRSYLYFVFCNFMSLHFVMLYFDLRTSSVFWVITMARGPSQLFVFCELCCLMGNSNAHHSSHLDLFVEEAPWKLLFAVTCCCIVLLEAPWKLLAAFSVGPHKPLPHLIYIIATSSRYTCTLKT